MLYGPSSHLYIGKTAKSAPSAPTSTSRTPTDCVRSSTMRLPSARSAAQTAARSIRAPSRQNVAQSAAIAGGGSRCR